MKKYIYVLCLMSMSTATWADKTWQCNNTVLLDLCNTVSCFQRSNPNLKGQTLKVSLQDNQQLSICTRTECWQGQLQSSQNNQSGILKLNEVIWRDPVNRQNHYLLTVNQKSNQIYFEGQKGKHALQCQMA